MRGMCAQDERGLEEQLVHKSRAAPVACGIEPLLPVGVLVGQTEAQKLGRKEADVRLDGPLPAGRVRILRRVVPRAERPPAPRLQLGPSVPPEAIAPALLVEVGRAIAVDIDAALHATDRVDPLGADGQQRMEPAVRPVLVLEIVSDEGAAQPRAGLAARDRRAGLQRLRVAELEERAYPAGDERLRQHTAAERRLVLTVED